MTYARPSPSVSNSRFGVGHFYSYEVNYGY